ncbi:BadF/BadG/BcrA/BcrD ATPase family protein [Actinocrispum sp. NPDC049592]|uniref:N-acetylglucosamine kinase n=1 Tax=Actinocrispum sp. NPDC049592 TaxID=3154835 RepID=UPI0034301D6B
MSGSDIVVIAIDGGNSKTDVLLVDGSGGVLGRARGIGASPQTVGVRKSLDTFEQLVIEAAAQAGTPMSPPFGAHTAAYLAGADLPKEEEVLERALAERGWSPSIVVGNDTFALLRAGTADGVGVAVVCGAGINCVGVSANGKVHRFPALGRISGDWGGGLHLGEEALWSAVRAADGRGPHTELLPAVIEHFDVRDIFDVVERLHFEGLHRSVLHELSPLLFTVAQGGDQVAGQIVETLVTEVVTMATVTLRKLEMTGEAPAIILGGGVLTGQSGALLAEITRRICAVAPRADVRVVDLPPVVGAALMGLDAIGAELAAKKRLRASAGLLSSVPSGVIGQGADGVVNGSAPGDADSVGERAESFGAS